MSVEKQLSPWWTTCCHKQWSSVNKILSKYSYVLGKIVSCRAFIIMKTNVSARTEIGHRVYKSGYFEYFLSNQLIVNEYWKMISRLTMFKRSNFQIDCDLWKAKGFEGELRRIFEKNFERVRWSFHSYNRVICWN